MPTHSTLNPDVLSPFEVTLARGLNMTRNRPPIQTASPEHKRRFLSLTLRGRQALAAALQREYHLHSSRLCDDEGALKVLNEQYSDAQCFVTPIYRLPAEILTEIFRIVLDINPSLIRVVLVCRRWYRVVKEMTGLQLPLELGTWTDPEMVRRAVGGMARRLLNITVHTDQDFEFGGLLGEPYSALATAAENASHWRSLTVHSLPRGGQLSDRSLHMLITSMGISPMSRLEEFRLTSELGPSPLVDRLLQNIGTTAIGGLMKMETNCLYTIRFLLQTPSTYPFRSLTTFRTTVQKMDEPIDLLPHFSKLEILELTNLLLPLYQDETPLPFVQTLRSLSLKTVSIEWMAGRVFPVLDACTIITPPIPFLGLDVHLSTCREFRFHHRCTASFGRFRMPMVSVLEVNSNQWSPLKGSKSLVHMYMAGLGTVLQPSVLHLTMLCNGSVLISALRLLPDLRELSLTLPRPSALGRRFFTALLAQPATMPLITVPGGFPESSPWFDWAEKQKRWYTAICPSLSVFQLWYQRWLRPSEQIEMVAPLLALGWTRQKTVTPLRSLCVHMKANSGDWNSVELVPVKAQRLTDLNIPHLRSLKLDDRERRALFQMNLTSAALSVLDGPYPKFRYITEALSGPSFHRLRVLRVHRRWDTKVPPFNVLHCFHHLEELALYGVQVSHCEHNIDLPLFRTLKRLTIWDGCATWLDGHTFLQLTSFKAWVRPGGNNSFLQRVDMPVCTHIVFFDRDLEFLPMFRAGIVAPLLYEWDMQGFQLSEHRWRSTKRAGIEALAQIRAQVFRMATWGYYQGLITVITSKHELEELSIKFSGNYAEALRLISAFMETTDPPLSTETPDEHVTTRGVCSGTATKVICPNLKALDLQFHYGKSCRGEVRKWCVQMMEGRKQAGNPLGRCCIWWSHDRNKDPPLVLITSNDGMIENE